MTTTTAYERVLDALTATTGQTPQGRDRTRMARCPAHNDGKASLSVTRGTDRVLMKCHAGCDTDDVLSSIGMSAADLFDEPRPAGRDDWTPCGHGITAEYPYVDEAGTLLFTVVRCPQKCFAQWRPDPASKSGKRWKLGDVRRVLYRLPELAPAIADKRTVWICEGEKDADALRARGEVATCNPHGAGKWRDEYTEQLAGSVAVTIVADKDEPGYAHARAIAASLRGTVETVEIVQAAVGKDAADHLAAGRNFLEFEDVTDAAGGETPARDATPTAIQWGAFLARDLTEIDWLPGQFVERGQQMALVGSGKAGKSLLVQEWAWRMAAGLPFLGDKPRTPLRVLYADRENSDSDIQERMLSFGATPAELVNLTYLSFPAYRPLDTREGAHDLLDDVKRYGAQVVILDTVSRFVEGKENDSDTWLNLYRFTHQPLEAAGITGARLDHFGKDTDKGARGNSAKTQDVDNVWELADIPGGLLRLKRTHTRTGHGEDCWIIRREGEKIGDRWLSASTQHAVHDMPADKSSARDVDIICRRLDAASVPLDYGRDRLRTECSRLHIKAGNDLLAEVVRQRKNLSRTGLPLDLSE